MSDAKLSVKLGNLTLEVASPVVKTAIREYARECHKLEQDRDAYRAEYIEAKAERDAYRAEYIEAKAERDALQEWKDDCENSFKNIMDEKCSLQERHCTCVPALREKVKELQGAVDAFCDFHHGADKNWKAHYSIKGLFKLASKEPK